MAKQSNLPAVQGQEQEQDAIVLPQWTVADFEDTDIPYRFLLVNRKKSKNRFEKVYAKAIKLAKQLGISNLEFEKRWRAYNSEYGRPEYASNENNLIAFPDQDYGLCSGKYLCNLDGVRYWNSNEEIIVIRHPIFPIERIVDVDTNEQKLLIKYGFTDMGKNVEWSETIVSREMLASAQRIIGLAKLGVAVTSENAKEVVKYISEVEQINRPKLAIQRSASHMGWLPNGQFAPYAEDIVFGGDSEEFQKLYDGFKPEGSEEKWLEIVRKVRNGKSIPARIALAASFAAPLVHKLGALSFFVHLWGENGTGKSVALMLGASVWCNPVIGSYIKSFSATKVSQELFAAFCCNLPVFMDELQVIADRRLFDDIIYALCEGVSKGRGTKDGGLQLSRRWETVFVTTGEMNIVQSNSGGGAAVRTIEVGFGGEPFFDDARAVANTLKENYGWAGKKFIEAITATSKEDLNKWQKEFYDELSGDVQDKQVLSASILLVADKLADMYIFHDGKALTAKDIAPKLVSKADSDRSKKTYDHLCEWVTKNKCQFLEDSQDRHGLWGDYDEKKNIVYVFREDIDRCL